VLDHGGHLEARGELLDKHGVLRRVRTELMIHVHDRELQAQGRLKPHQDVQERHRVRPARDADHHTVTSMH
jgi:capsule polysaccharide export protein KpsC/LpsZ